SLWALDWIDKSLKARRAGKRVVAEVVTRADAPSVDLAEAKAKAYLANTPRAEQRWMHIWLQQEGWLCEERPRASKPERASKAAKPEPGKRFSPGVRVRNAETAQLGRVHNVGFVLAHVRWDSGEISPVGMHDLRFVPDEASKAESSKPNDEAESVVCLASRFPIGSRVRYRECGEVTY